MAKIKQRAMDIFNQHVAIAATDPTLFRRTVIEQIMVEFKTTHASAATDYNTCKNNSPEIPGLGRPKSAVVRKAPKNKEEEDLQADNDCFTVIELLALENGDLQVGRCMSHLLQGDASEQFDDITQYKPKHCWVMIKGLGPLVGEDYKLQQGESEIKIYVPTGELVVDKRISVEPVEEEIAA